MLQSETYVVTHKNVDYSVPEICPHCHKKMSTKIITQSDPMVIKKVTHIALLCQCGICDGFFALAYLVKNPHSNNPETYLIPYDYQPTIEVNIPEYIDSISEQFREIYTQAKLAEEYNLNQIAGMGYRKATEYLVKDYLIFKKVDDENIIHKTRLGNAIDKIDNDKIQTLAKASTYLGNDETHPIRRHPGKDIKDLKMFLEALIHFVAFELSISDAADMIAEN